MITGSAAMAWETVRERDGQGMPLWALVDAVPDAGLVIGGNGRIMAANTRCLAVFGYEPGSLVGRPIELLIPDHARRAHGDNVAGYLEHPTARPMGRPLSLRAKRADGSLVAVDVSLNPISLASGPAVVVSVRDISSLANSTWQLRESERQLKRLVEDLPFAAVSIDSAGTIRYCNAYLCELSGYDSSELVGARWAEVLSPPSDDSDRMWLQAVAGDGFMSRYESPLRTRDGQIRLLEWSNTRHMDEHGEVLTVTCIGEDVTTERLMQREREQLIEQLRRVNAERMELLGRLTCAEEKERRRIAHELHDDAIQSLTGVGLLTASLKVEDGERLKVRRIQDILSGSISGLRRLMFELHPGSLGHSGLTAALDKLLADLAGEEELEVRFDTDRYAGEVDRAQETCLFRICQEALTNVRKHAHATRVDVELLCEDDEVLLRVADDGVGTDSLSSAAGHLGLVSMHERAEIAGGRLEVESAPGRGTTVRCLLPRRAP
ncbi:MAG TPA: PAS domain S-box protein [Gaiellales bacterium]|nr:PAS domain S-box protein [Gaiellales bacterium]